MRSRGAVGGIAPDDVGSARGFRVAYLPEPDGLAGALAGVATLAALRTRRNPAGAGRNRRRGERIDVDDLEASAARALGA